MAMITVRNLDENIKRKLRLRAAQNGRSMEAEVRELLTAAVDWGYSPPANQAFAPIRESLQQSDDRDDGEGPCRMTDSQIQRIAQLAGLPVPHQDPVDPDPSTAEGEAYDIFRNCF